MKKKLLKGTLVVIGAVIITALGIDAADTIGGNQGTLLSQVIDSTGDGCPAGMVAVGNIPSLTCADAYEVSTGEDCLVDNPTNILDSNKNIEDGNCEPESVPEATPWRFVTRDQAMQACARVGKRLPTSGEWYQLSLGMSDSENACNVSSGSLSDTGAHESCVSPVGSYDLVGNVWEWVSNDVIDGSYNGRDLPETGYVGQVDGDGMATVSTSTEQELYGDDYFWAKESGAYGVLRGGFYDSGSDAGIYTVHADTPPNTAGTAIGFRCVR